MSTFLRLGGSGGSAVGSRGGGRNLAGRRGLIFGLETGDRRYSASKAKTTMLSSFFVSSLF